MSVKEKLKKWCIANNISFDTDDDLQEILTDYKVVHQGEIDEHRWYYFQELVVKVSDDFYISYYDCNCTGDGELPDDWFSWDSVREVKPVEKMCIVYEEVEDE